MLFVPCKTTSGVVPLTIRRHLMQENDELLKDMVAHEFEVSRKALMDELLAGDAARYSRI